MHRRPINDLGTVANGQVVRDRDGLAMRDAIAMKVAGPWRPGPHARAGSRLHEVYGGHATEVVPFAGAGEVAFVRSPAHLAGLRALAHEPVDGPGVDELAGLLGHARDLGVALRDVNDLDAQLARELAPFAAGSGLAGVHLRVGGDIEQRLLDEMRYEPRVGAVREHRGRRPRIARTQSQRFLPQSIVGAASGGDSGVGITARPGLDARVEVHRALLPAELDERDAGDLDRNVDQEVAAPEQRIEDPAVVLASEPLLDEADAVAGSLGVAAILRCDDGDAIGRYADV